LFWARLQTISVFKRGYFIWGFGCPVPAGGKVIREKKMYLMGGAALGAGNEIGYIVIIVCHGEKWKGGV
jgi:hypothetical protein